MKTSDNHQQTTDNETRVRDCSKVPRTAESPTAQKLKLNKNRNVLRRHAQIEKREKGQETRRNTNVYIT